MGAELLIALGALTGIAATWVWTLSAFPSIGSKFKYRAFKIGWKQFYVWDTEIYEVFMFSSFWCGLIWTGFAATHMWLMFPFVLALIMFRRFYSSVR